MENIVLPALHIREASLEDLNIIVDFNLALALETENRTLDKKILTQSIQTILQNPAKGVYLLACFGEKVVGQLMYVYEWSTWRNANFMWLTDLYILPNYRKKGIFNLLSKHAMDLYHKNENVVGLRFCVDKENTAVVPLYKKAGWKESNYNLWEIKKDGCQ